MFHGPRPTDLRDVFVVGSQRSGTTLLAQVVGAHPLAYLVDEHDGLQARLLGLLASSGSVPLSTVDYLRSFRVARRKYRKPNLRCDSLGRLRRSIRLLVWKAPNLTFYGAVLASHYPDASAVYLIRDLRDVVSSMRDLRGGKMAEVQLERIRAVPEVYERFRDDVRLAERRQTPVHLRLALVARLKMMLVEQFERAGLPTLVVRYEDLVLDTPRCIERMRVELSISDAPELHNHASVFTGLGPGGTVRTRPIDAASVGGWRKRLTPQEESDIWSVFEPLARQYGYRR